MKTYTRVDLWNKFNEDKKIPFERFIAVSDIKDLIDGGFGLNVTQYRKYLKEALK